LILAISVPQSAFAQLGYAFGRNKVQYRKFNWKIIKTPHFDVYYYDEEEEGARIGARMAERSYEMLSSRIGHEIEEKIPLILYASHNDFQQTNAIGGLIPEGVRGVTESFKRRVVLPMGGSMREFTHVLTHELVHAFQYDILQVGPTGSSLRSMPPLWVMEGLAEYYSQGLDAQTEMWLRDAVENATLPTVDELSSIYDIRVYRIGNALWQYIGTKYGDESVGRIFTGIPQSGGFPNALLDVVGIDTGELSQSFSSFLEERYAGAESSDTEIALQPVTRHEGFYYNLNAVPAISRDGSRIAFISNRSLYNDIYVVDVEGKNEPKRLVKGARSGSLEILRFLDTSLSWSSDGALLCFVAKAGKQDAVYLVDSSSGKVKKKITPELNGLMSPDFSPDGRSIVFTGISGGISDLYIYDLDEEVMLQLTDDLFADLGPRWSPDGKYIAFITDRGERTDEDRLLFGDDNIAVYDLESGKVNIAVDTPADEGSPSWIEGGRKLLFTSEYEGRPAMFVLEMEDCSVSLLASVTPWVSGITRYTPSLSGSDTNIALSAMDRGGWDIYLFPSTGSPEQEEILVPVSADTGLIDHLELYDLLDGSEFEEEEYGITLEPDYLIGGIGFSSNLGFQGASQLLISDMLGNHNIIIGTRAYEDLGSSDFLIAYQNLAHRMNFVTSFYQFRNDFGLFTAPDPDEDEIEFLSQVYRGGAVLAGYPLDTFRRLEIGGGFTTVSEKIVTQSFLGFGEVEEENLGTAKYVTGNLAYVMDNSIFGFTGPLSGRRVRYSVEKSFGDLEYTTLIMDYRRYFNINRRSLIAQRAILAGSFGETPQIFRIGGPYTFRGNDYGDLMGTRILILNTEYRFPLLYFLGPQLDFLQGVFFWDMASAWERNLQPFTDGGRLGFHLNDLAAAYGAGVRLGMGYLILKLDFAWETDLDSTGKNFVFFSIGSDF
jgi:Tol biopolymer transport system component